MLLVMLDEGMTRSVGFERTVWTRMRRSSRDEGLEATEIDAHEEEGEDEEDDEDVYEDEDDEDSDGV